MSKSKLEYIWLDGYKPTQNMRSKTKVIEGFSGKLVDCPIWSFDGSSTKQAEGGSSDCLLKPVAIYPDPVRRNEDFLPSGSIDRKKFNIKKHIIFNTQVKSSSWKHNQWTTKTNHKSFSSQFIIFCTGSRDRNNPHLPKFENESSYHLCVKDLHVFIKQLSISWLQNFNGKIVGITGSNGKTTTKDLIAHLLQSKFKVEKTLGNYNTSISVPLSILSFALE